MTRSNHSRRKEVRAYMARHGLSSYTQALRALETQQNQDPPRPQRSLPQPLHVEQGGPALPSVVTPEHDINPVCGHWLGNRCAGCATCTTCDGCYCEEARREAELDARDRRVEAAHAEHWDEPDEQCPVCARDQERSKNFTECPTCRRELQGFWHFREHNPPYCRPDYPHPPGLDWSHLIGKRITIDTHWRYQGDMAKYATSWTGTVTGRWKNENTGDDVTGYYTLELDPSVPQPQTDLATTPFNPREFTITEH
ncbi:hypothetical protein [Nocardia cyriacigeorgica]|uniref:hypothetical protein n=1 Tax=Nocardia cyriacigeorgica TaxID=135487 RepID=UPI00189445B4|nr:hypothetical protein [Nocardia cyriacigeorgica]MBF6163020.1 hypothetical protein [Nocardia cyriacigeorgica]MBF6201955.1 hypothetical protein [Nocardia cyriacigeorgica]